MAWYGGVDLGATNVKAAVGDDAGVVVGQAERPTPTGPDGDAVGAAVVETLVDAAADGGVAPNELVAVGVGSVGPLDSAAGAVVDSANLPAGIEHVPLVDPLEERFGAEVTLHNDAVAGVIGERFYADRTPADMAYVTISSGIGAGVTVDGNVLSGWDGNAAEVGHWMVEPGGLPCGCGVDGHWEAYCSGNNIPQHARHIHETESIETRLPLDSPEFDASTLFAAAGEDPLADRTIEACAEYNAVGIADLVHAYAPLVVHIGGAVATNNPELVVKPLRERVPELVMSNVPEITLTQLADRVVVRGALAAAITTDAGDRTKR
ncbi:ROK family protein [Halolamina sp.]|jgi:glucokinase|uniref:ROK family protein n=1 Tax=Halolamina sp. TaxID=1940283 RepID=UPI000223BCC7|nr:ROK family protein [halophilic archaeon DL31]